MAEPVDENIRLNYKGETRILEINSILSLVINEMKEFDKLRLEYCERGNILMIEADEKNVTMKSKENQKQESKEESHFNSYNFV